MTDAFIKEDMRKEPTGSGILDGLTFGVKDVISVAGHTNAAGNPDWLNTHAPAQHNAPVIDRLLEEGALLHGMTHTDELMYSLNGENVHYGTPINPSPLPVFLVVPQVDRRQRHRVVRSISH